jgi:hypothetical protein
LSKIAKKRLEKKKTNVLVGVTVQELEDLLKSNSYYSEQLLLDKYSEGVDLFMFLEDDLNLLIVENIRFIVIQVIIVSIQLLNRVQVMMVWFLNIGYLVYFFYELFQSKKVIIRESNGMVKE